MGLRPKRKPREVYEALHQVECRMRTHAKWVNDVEGDVLLIYLAQEACSAVYTAAVALFTEQPMLECVLLVYSLVQLYMLFCTGRDIAQPGDTFRACVSNLDTPRTLYMMQTKLVAGPGESAPDYLAHLLRSPVGINIWRTLVRTPTVMRVCFTVAVPTIGVILRSLGAFLDSQSPARLYSSALHAA